MAQKATENSTNPYKIANSCPCYLVPAGPPTPPTTKASFIRDGASACGWWIGPIIGGNEVWGYNSNKATKTLPIQGWQVPHNGGIDPTFVVKPLRADDREIGVATKFVIEGCKHQVFGPVVRGRYTMAGTNHEKPIYKQDLTDNEIAVMIYFHDERDGPRLSGWWMDDSVGGDEVWGYNPNRSVKTMPMGASNSKCQKCFQEARPTRGKRSVLGQASLAQCVKR